MAERIGPQTQGNARRLGLCYGLRLGWHGRLRRDRVRGGRDWRKRAMTEMTGNLLFTGNSFHDDLQRVRYCRRPLNSVN